MSKDSNITNTSIKTYKPGVIISAVFSIAASVVYALAYHFNYNSETWHYKSGTYLIYVSAALFIAGAIAALATAAANRKLICGNNIIERSQSSTFFLYLTACMFIGYFIVSLISPSDVSDTVFDKIAPILGLLSSVPMFCLANKKTRGCALHCYSSFLPIFWTAAVLFNYYFDLTHMPVNSPEKNITNVALAVLILFFLSETRETVGMTNLTFTIFSAVTAAFINGTIAVSRIILYFTDSLNHPSFIENVMMFTISLYALSKIGDIYESISNKDSVPKLKDENF